MSNSEVDLDIDHYTFHELFDIFKIKNKFKIHDNKNKIESHLKKIKGVFPEEIYHFYYKAKTLLFTIFQLCEENYVDHLEDEPGIYNYINKLKNIDNFENYEIDKLIQMLTQKPSEKTYNNFRDIQDDLDVLNNPLNEKYPNISGRINPSLNNRNNTNVVQSTFSNEISPGYLNSIKRIIQTQNLNLNSCFRSNYYNTNPCDYLYILPSEVKNVVSMRLASIEIPNAWYLFSHNKKNNFFKIIIIIKKKNTEEQEEQEEYEEYEEKKEYTILIPDGNYDSETLENYLNETYFYQSEEEEDEEEEKCLLKFIKFSINQYNFKSSFEIILEEEDDTLISFSLHFMEDINQNIMNSLGWALGFRATNYINITGKIVSEGLFDGGGDRYIYVSINDYQYNDNNFNTVCFDKSILTEDVIAKIPMVNGKLALIIDDVDNPLTKTRRYNGPVNISRLQIKILDKFGSVIDLNNMDYSFTLELEILYESFNFKNVTS